MLGGDELVEMSLTSLPFGPYGVVLIILFAVFLLGFFLDWIEICLIILPLLAPVVEKLGLNIDGQGVVENPAMVWFTVLVAVTLQTSFLSPPVGPSIFFLQGVTKEVKLMDIYKGVVPFIILQLIGITVVLLWPQLVVWLPVVVYR
jgi:TRAP-type mannitol/chloroaromatic compound transport system permease large subunit